MTERPTVRRACAASAAGAALVVLLSCGGASQQESEETAARYASTKQSGVPHGTLRVVVSGIAHETGEVFVALYDSAQTFPKSHGEVAGGKATARAGATVVALDDVPDGRYALAVFHDVDGDGALDTSIVGYPTEPFAFSNNAKVRLFGPPTFEACAFDVHAPVTTVTLTLDE